jgi:hypothetical protein
MKLHISAVSPIKLYQNLSKDSKGRNSFKLLSKVVLKTDYWMKITFAELV